MKKQKIIVLAHPRSGSSMLMQTLRLLGVDVIGKFEREDLPQEANPNGYYEDRKILRHGLTDRTIVAIEAHHVGCLAVKIALSLMVEEDRLAQWQYLQANRATILIPIRHPLEIALSRQVFNMPQDNIERFRWITSFLREYQLQFKALAEIVMTRVPGLLPNLHVISHCLAYDNPQKYVETVASFLVAEASVKQKAEALANINPSLYRYKLDDFEDEAKKWHRKIGASAIYDALIELENPWPIINTMELKWQSKTAAGSGTVE